MTSYTITIRTENAAFYSDDDDKELAPRPELARILHKLADDIANGRDIDRNLFDFNGNKVGEARYAD